MKHIKYPSIDRITQSRLERVTKDKITFHGTIKLHGTNAGITYDGNTLVAQSRKNILEANTKHTNFGFANFVDENKQVIKDLLDSIVTLQSGDVVTIFGEWAGNGVQKGVGLSQLEDKKLFVFGLLLTKSDESQEWLDFDKVRLESHNIYNILDFPTYKLEVEVGKVGQAINKMVEITNAVEAECPVAKAFGVDNGIGEGVVWTTFLNGDRVVFKCKGDKHSTTAKATKPIDPETIKMGELTLNFAQFVVAKPRVEQAVTEVNDEGVLGVDNSNFGKYIQWVIADVFKEESDTYNDWGLTPDDRKMVCKNISKVTVAFLKGM